MLPREQKKNRDELVKQKNKLLEELKPMRIEKIKGDAEIKN
jgi:hypothetical protein